MFAARERGAGFKMTREIKGEGVDLRGERCGKL